MAQALVVVVVVAGRIVFVGGSSSGAQSRKTIGDWDDSSIAKERTVVCRALHLYLSWFHTLAALLVAWSPRLVGLVE